MAKIAVLGSDSLMETSESASYDEPGFGHVTYLSHGGSLTCKMRTIVPSTCSAGLHL